MIDQVRWREFRRAAFGKKLLITSPRYGERCHLFALAKGDVFAPPEWNKVQALVDLARQYAINEQYGEHLDLKRLVSFDAELERFRRKQIHCLMWIWRGYTSDDQDPSRLVTVEWWLEKEERRLRAK